MSNKITSVLILCLLGFVLKATSYAQYSAAKVKEGITAADKANLSAEPKTLVNRVSRLIEVEQQALLRKDISPEWRLGYGFEAWFIMMVQYRSLKSTLAPDEAEACTNSITSYGQKFRKIQKELGLNDEQLFKALGKSPNIPEIYADYWPSMP